MGAKVVIEVPQHELPYLSNLLRVLSRFDGVTHMWDHVFIFVDRNAAQESELLFDVATMHMEVYKFLQICGWRPSVSVEHRVLSKCVLVKHLFPDAHHFRLKERRVHGFPCSPA